MVNKVPYTFDDANFTYMSNLIYKKVCEKPYQKKDEQDIDLGFLDKTKMERLVKELIRRK